MPARVAASAAIFLLVVHVVLPTAWAQAVKPKPAEVEAGAARVESETPNIATPTNVAPLEVSIEPIDISVTPCLYIPWPNCTGIEMPILRHVFLEASRTLTVDLVKRPLTSADGNRSLDPEVMKLSPERVAIDPLKGGDLTIRLTLAHVPSGEYQGAVILSTDNNRTVVPIKLRLRHPIDFVLAVLLLGLVISLGVTSYVVKRKDLDNVMIAGYRLEDRVNRDPDIHATFKSKILSELDRAQFSLRREDIEQAREILKSATDYWEKWRQHTAGWMHHLAELDTLLERIEAMQGKNNELVSLQKELHALEIDAVDFGQPDELDAKLAEPYQLFQRADRVNTSLNRLAHLIDRLREDLDNATKSAELSRFDAYKDRFKQLDLQNEVQVEDLNTAVNAAVDQLRDKADAYLAPEPVPAQSSLGHIVSDVVANWLRKSGEQHLESFAGMLSRRLLPRTLRLPGADLDRVLARLRRASFRTVGYVVLMVILAGSGLQELYLGNPTFGADIWSDYISLFAWGFGAEATRNSVVRLASSWQLPGLQHKTGA